MKIFNFLHLSIISVVFAFSLTPSVSQAQRSNPLTISFYYPSNGAAFTAPTNVPLYVELIDSNALQSVQFYAGTTLIGTGTNVQTGRNTGGATNYYWMLWSNPAPAVYSLTAVGSDVAGNVTTSAPLTITVQSAQPPPPPQPSVYIYSPSNNSIFSPPANISIFANAIENGGAIQSVEFFAGQTSLGIVSNTIVYVNRQPLYALTWSNVLTGNYALLAVATDTNGVTATSQVVNVIVTNQTPPPPPPHPEVAIYSPTNSSTFTAPANISIYARAVETNGAVQSVEFFAGRMSLGVVSNSGSSAPLYALTWSNVPAGDYPLFAVATDVAGTIATSPVVNISVIDSTPPGNQPPVVRIISPPDAATFQSPVDIPIYAYASDPDGFVTGVEFFAGTNDLGPGSPVSSTRSNAVTGVYSNYFFIVWSNAPVGAYALTAQAMDNSNAVSVSRPVNITVVPPRQPPTNPAPIILITATDPIAIEGTNCWVWSGITNAVPDWTNWTGGRVPFTNCGPKNATFTVYNYGDTNNALTVNYSIGGTATNGIQYATLPSSIIIPAGQRTAIISIVPVDDGPPDVNMTVILSLAPSSDNPPSYAVSRQSAAEAIILDAPPATTSRNSAATTLPDGTFRLSSTGPNGAWFRVESSTDLQTWTRVCTNQVINGSVDFADPNSSNATVHFYRAVPEAPPQ